VGVRTARRMFLRVTRGRVCAAVAIVLSLTLTGCGLETAAPGAITPQIRALGSGLSTHLYVWNESVPPAELDEYATGGGRPALRVPSPFGLFAVRGTIDGAGALYLVGGTPYAPNVSVYKAGSSKPFQTITKGVGQVIGLATDTKNDLYVLNLGGPLVKYAAGATNPEFATYSGLCASGYGGPGALATDRSDDLYVGAICGKPGGHSHAIISEYAGGPKPKRTISLDPSQHPIGFTVDGSGRLYVSFADADNKYRLAVAEYVSGATKPAVSFYFGPSGSQDGVQAGLPVVDDSTGVLYQTYGSCRDDAATLTCSSAISLFARGARVAARTLNGPADAILGTPVLDTGGNLYVEAQSPKSPLIGVLRYEKGTWKRTKILSNRKLFLAFAWPTIASAHSSFAGAQFAGANCRVYVRSGSVACGDARRKRLP